MAFAVIDLRPLEAEHLREIARSKRVKETSVVRRWILEKRFRLPGDRSRGRCINGGSLEAILAYSSDLA